jgi:hypothetical protein
MHNHLNLYSSDYIISAIPWYTVVIFIYNHLNLYSNNYIILITTLHNISYTLVYSSNIYIQSPKPVL